MPFVAVAALGAAVATIVFVLVEAGAGWLEKRQAAAENARADHVLAVGRGDFG